jgi:hypothetical protein
MKYAIIAQVIKKSRKWQVNLKSNKSYFSILRKKNEKFQNWQRSSVLAIGEGNPIDA